MDDEKIQDFQVSTKVKAKEFPYKGKTIKVWYVDINRRMFMEAGELAALAFMERFPGKEGALPSVFERELVNRILKRTNLPAVPGLGWDVIEKTLADEIIKQVEMRKQLDIMQGVEEGKNSSPEAPESSATSDPDAPSSSSTPSLSTPASAP